MKHLIYYSLTFLFISLFNSDVYAQRDSSYVTPLPDTKVIGLHTTLQQFQLSFRTSDSEPVNFESYNLGVGFRFKLKKIGASISVPILNVRDRSDARLLGLGFGLFPKSFYVFGQLKIVSGLQDFRALTNNPISTFQNSTEGFYANLFGAYLFNRSRYSLRSAFRMVDRQTRSAGSWLGNLVIEYQSFNTDSLVLPLSGNADLIVDRFQNFKVGLGGGYAYTYVLGHWSATALLSGVFEFRNMRYNAADTFTNRTRLLITPRLLFFGSLLHNKDRFFYGLTGHYLPAWDQADGLNTQIISWSLRASVGWRL